MAGTVGWSNDTIRKRQGAPTHPRVVSATRYDKNMAMKMETMSCPAQAYFPVGVVSD